MKDLTIQDVFPKEGKYTFLVGAGCSIDPPSCLPAGKSMMRAIIRYSCAEGEVEKLLGLENLRFEHLVEVVRDRLDPELKIIDYYGLCDKPNSIHFFLAEMLKRGHYVITTNFDYLIELALEESIGGIGKNLPVITKEDFQKYSDVRSVIQNGYFPIYKIHGSPRNIITDTSTKESLIATIQAFGSGKEGESVFQLEPYKRPLFEYISKDRTLVVLGYSGSDDFDIVPTLKQLPELKQIVWIEHTSDESQISVQEFHPEQRNTFHGKIGSIFQEIRQMGYFTKLIHVKMPTAKIIQHMGIDLNYKLVQEDFDVDLDAYLQNEIPPPNVFLEDYIPYKIYSDLSLVNDAERCSRVILERAKREKNLKWESVALSNIAFLLSNKGDFEKALDLYKKSLIIAEQSGYLRDKAVALNNIGQILYEKGKLDESMQYYIDSLAIAEKSNYTSTKTAVLNNIALVWHLKGNLDASLRYYKEVLRINEQMGDLQGKATRLNNIGQIYCDKGDLTKGLEYYKESLAIVEQLGNLQGKAKAYNNIGKLLYEKGEYNKALQYYNEALKIDEQLEDIQGKSITLNNIGHLLQEIGELDKAEQYYDEVLAIAELLGNLHLKKEIFGNIGLLWHDKGELDKALDYYKKSLAIDEQMGDLRGKATRLNNIGQILYEKGELETAFHHYTEALAIDEKLGDLQGKASHFNNIGLLLYALDELNTALDYYSEALAIDEQLGNLRGKATRLNNISAIYFRQGNISEALKHAESSLSILEQIGGENSSDAQDIRKNIAILKAKLEK